MRKIIHVDMDCFFAAVEMRDDPSLRDIPLAIGGSADRRGVISTANYPARRYGVHSAMSTAMALKLCPHLTLLPGRMAAYKEASLHIREIFARYTPLIEPLSLDEAYLDVTDSPQCNGSATLIAQEIRQAIADELNLTASAGVAPIASRQNRLRDEQAERAIRDHAGAGAGVFAAAAQQDPRRRQGDCQKAGGRGLSPAPTCSNTIWRSSSSASASSAGCCGSGARASIGAKSRRSGCANRWGWSARWRKTFTTGKTAKR